MAARFGLTVHVGHGAGVIAVEPGAQAIEPVGGRRWGDADELETQGAGAIFETFFKASRHGTPRVIIPAPRCPPRRKSCQNGNCASPGRSAARHSNKSVGGSVQWRGPRFFRPRWRFLLVNVCQGD